MSNIEGNTMIYDHKNKHIKYIYALLLFLIILFLCYRTEDNYFSSFVINESVEENHAFKKDLLRLGFIQEYTLSVGEDKVAIYQRHNLFSTFLLVVIDNRDSVRIDIKAKLFYSYLFRDYRRKCIQDEFAKYSSSKNNGRSGAGQEFMILESR